MTIKLAGSMAALAAGLIFASVSAAGQASKLETTRAAPSVWTPARMPDGQPDVQGFWQAVIGGTYSLTEPSRGGVGLQDELGIPRKRNPSRIVDPPDGKIPYLPWAAEKQKYIAANINDPVKEEFIDPQARCLPDGPIRATFWSAFQALQYPGYVVLEYESNRPYRIIPLDGRPHIGEGIKLWMGDSRGHWEGNTLVVDVTNNNSKSRLSNQGDFASDKLHIVERYIFLDSNRMRYEATLEDASVYTRPWKISADMVRAHTGDPGYEQWEEACHEGERNVGDSLRLPAGSQP